jgi:hypothetical protein
LCVEFFAVSGGVLQIRRGIIFAVAAKPIMYGVAGNFAEEIMLYPAHFKFVAVKPVGAINHNDMIINVHCLLLHPLRLNPVAKRIKDRKKNFLFPGA